MSKIAIFATLTAQPGKGDELVAALEPMFDQVAEEDGTELYVLHRADAEPDVVRFYELYRDADAATAHGRSDAIKALGARLAEVVAGPPELVMTTPLQAKGLAV